MPLLKREPEIWPPHLFGEPGSDAPDPSEARAAAAIHHRGPAQNGHGHLFGNGHGNGYDEGQGAVGPDHWWVTYTLSRQEKTLARHLLHWEIPYYLPQREHRIRAGDRWRKSHLPLFTGYVFFHGDLHDRLMALRSNVVVKLIQAPAPEELASQLRSLWLLQMTGAPLVPHPYIGPGDEVEIFQGPLRGYRGQVLREKGKYRLVVSISLLRQAVSTEVPRDAVAPTAMRKVQPRQTAHHAAMVRDSHS